MTADASRPSEEATFSVPPNQFSISCPRTNGFAKEATRVYCYVERPSAAVGYGRVISCHQCEYHDYRIEWL